MARPTYVAAQHMLENIHLIERFASKKSKDEVLGDPVLSAAVFRWIECISEASRSIPPEVKADYPAVPWHDIATIGNELRHRYDGVNDTIIWRVVTVDAPALKPTIVEMIEKTRDIVAVLDPLVPPRKLPKLADEEIAARLLPGVSRDSIVREHTALQKRVAAYVSSPSVKLVAAFNGPAEQLPQILGADKALRDEVFRLVSSFSRRFSETDATAARQTPNGLC
jgi:uncharacterized protein with HEPN domain